MVTVAKPELSNKRKWNSKWSNLVKNKRDFTEYILRHENMQVQAKGIKQSESSERSQAEEVKQMESSLGKFTE